MLNVAVLMGRLTKDPEFCLNLLDYIKKAT
jgi:hypothetical protein